MTWKARPFSWTWMWGPDLGERRPPAGGEGQGPEEGGGEGFPSHQWVTGALGFW